VKRPSRSALRPRRNVLPSDTLLLNYRVFVKCKRVTHKVERKMWGLFGPLAKSIDGTGTGAYYSFGTGHNVWRIKSSADQDVMIPPLIVLNPI
jgi:hypothetical protein